MRAHDAAPVAGTTGHGKIDGSASKILNCAACGNRLQTKIPDRGSCYCFACISRWPMLRFLSAQVSA